MTCGRLFIGIDIGTSGCRACAINEAGVIAGKEAIAFPADEQGPKGGWQAVLAVLQGLLANLDKRRIAAIAVDGTSGTVLLTDEVGQPLAPPLMYPDARATVEAELIARTAPQDSAAHGPASSLAKFLWLQKRVLAKQARHVLHQADWIMGCLCTRFGLSDENNCLKLGYNPVSRCWPQWLISLDIDRRLLPKVYPPGTPVGEIDGPLAKKLGLPAIVEIVTGTTDSTAGVIAAGARRVG
jgi:sugar (pentulose or hexulose) kinase